MQHILPWRKAAAGLAVMGLAFAGVSAGTEVASAAAISQGPLIRTFHVGGTTIRGSLRLFARPRIVMPAVRAGRPLAAAPAAGEPAFKIINARSGKCLEVFHSLKQNLTDVDQFTCNGTKTQSWQFGLVGTFQGNPVYELINANSGLCADIYYSGTGNGVKVIQFGCKGSYNQYWIAVVVNGLYLYVNYDSGKVLEVFKGSKADYGVVDQWADNGTTTQSWHTAT